MRKILLRTIITLCIGMLCMPSVGDAQSMATRTYYSLGHRVQCEHSQYSGASAKVVLPEVTGLTEAGSTAEAKTATASQKQEVAYQYLGVDMMGQALDIGLMKTAKDEKQWHFFAYHVTANEQAAKQAFAQMEKRYAKSGSLYGKWPFYKVWTELPDIVFPDGATVTLTLEVQSPGMLRFIVTDGKKSYTIPYAMARAGVDGKGLILRRESNLIAYGNDQGIDATMKTLWHTTRARQGKAWVPWEQTGYFYRDDADYQAGVPKNVQATVTPKPFALVVEYGIKK